MEKYENYLIIDFEATCCNQNTVPRQEMEIIEFGAVMMRGADYNVLSEFQTFVRPQRHPKLTPFCKKLTSIQQQHVDNAATFPQVIDDFKQWLFHYQNYVFCSWGDYDRHQLLQDCRYHNVPYPINAPHLNVKKQFAQQQNLSKSLGLGQAIEYVGLSFAGTHHRGIDDAKNIARLMPYILQT